MLPKSFELFGNKITVTQNLLDFKDFAENIDGFAIYARNEIQIRPSTELRPIDEKYQESVFWHEVSHFILNKIGKSCKNAEDINKDESFVDLMGCMLHQVFNTLVFEHKK